MDGACGIEGTAALEGRKTSIPGRVINVADIMLVFACGLMLALAVYWNIDLGGRGTN